MQTPLLLALLHALGVIGYEQSADKVREKREEMDAQPSVLNGSLEGKQYLLGDRFTIADLNVTSVFQRGLARWTGRRTATAQAWHSCF